MRRFIALALLAVLAGPAAAQDFPTRQITVVAPYAPGGSIDLVARLVAEGLRARLGQAAVVENRAGGNGVIGTRDVVKAPPDGYTLLIGSVGSIVIPAAMASDYPFDPLRDFTPVSMVAEWDAVLCVRKDFPADDLAQFIAYARAHPGKLNFGSTGYASFTHLIAEVLMHATGITMQHVPYKSGSSSMADLLAGAIDAVFTSSAVAAGQAHNKDVKLIAVAAKQRAAMLANVPTMAEAGVAGVDQTSWIGVLGPAGLPPPVRAALSEALVAAVREPDAQAKMRRIGFEPVGSDATTFEAFYRAEVKRWADFVRQRGLRAGP